MGSSAANGFKKQLDEVHPVQPIACVAEADEATREAITETLKVMGYKTFETDRGELALFMTAQVHISLLVVDVVLPDMSGIDVIKQVRVMTPDARIVALSDGGRAALPLFCELAYHAGAHVALAAPFTVTAICAAVHEAWHDDPAKEPWAPPSVAHRVSADMH